MYVRGLVDPQGRVGIKVEDTGLGMTSEQLASLFQPFNLLGRESSAIEGCGLGCALSKELMVMMGGDLRVESEPGRGTRVALWLPKGAEELMAVPATRPAGLDDPVVPPEGVVLYIEDNPVNTIPRARRRARSLAGPTTPVRARVSTSSRSSSCCTGPPSF